MRQDIDRVKLNIKARELHREIWHKQDKLWPDRQLMPIQMLEPEAVCAVLGIKYETFDNASTVFSFRGQKFRTDGLLDRQAGKIAVANSLPEKVSRFTAMHEIGHWILHKDQVMHRDRAVEKSDHSNYARPLIEREADYLAASFLMPENLLKAYFEETFQTETPLRFNEAHAFWLNPDDPDALLMPEYGSLVREFALARCESFNMKNFYSLASQFRVSDSAMAIRMKELGLVSWP